jgi:dsRNA-specific ribonuclease
LSNENLAVIANRTDLASYRLRNNSQSTFSTVQAATLIEAIIGAVCIDSGSDMEAVKTSMRALGINEVVMFLPPAPD